MVPTVEGRSASNPMSGRGNVKIKRMTMPSVVNNIACPISRLAMVSVIQSHAISANRCKRKLIVGAVLCLQFLLAIINKILDFYGHCRIRT